MKKNLLIIIMIIAVATNRCKEKKSKSLNYNDSNPIVIALSGTTNEFDRQIDVTSDYDITYTAINDGSVEVITVSADGKLHGKNVGTAKVGISNGYESLVVDVKVDLFIEPTFEFGCSPSRIKSLYGSPYQSGYNNNGDLVYIFTGQHGYSYACGEMDFFFDGEKKYKESDVYIRPSVDFLLNNYLNERFYLDTIIGDTLSIYRFKLDNDIICGKFASHNQWNEWCLFYYRLDGEKSLANSLKTRPRSSKFLY